MKKELIDFINTYEQYIDEEDWNNIHKSMYWDSSLSSFITTIDYDYKGV